jgi:hypothetical protein
MFEHILFKKYFDIFNRLIYKKKALTTKKGHRYENANPISD